MLESVLIFGNWWCEQCEIFSPCIHTTIELNTTPAKPFELNLMSNTLNDTHNVFVCSAIFPRLNPNDAPINAQTTEWLWLELIYSFCRDRTNHIAKNIYDLLSHFSGFRARDWMWSETARLNTWQRSSDFDANASTVLDCHGCGVRHCKIFQIGIKHFNRFTVTLKI